MLAAVETAIIAAITTAQLAWRPATVASYGGEWDDDLAIVIRKMPGVWIAYGGGPLKRLAKNRYQRAATIAVMVGNRNIRAEAATRHGTTAQGGKLLEVGTYQMLHDIAGLLADQQFNLDIAPIEPHGIRTLFNTRLGADCISVLALECKTSWIETWGAANPAPGNMTQIRVDYHTPGRQADVLASDLIILPQE
jgi:phage gp37-like protein